MKRRDRMLKDLNAHLTKGGWNEQAADRFGRSWSLSTEQVAQMVEELAGGSRAKGAPPPPPSAMATKMKVDEWNLEDMGDVRRRSMRGLVEVTYDARREGNHRDAVAALKALLAATQAKQQPELAPQASPREVLKWFREHEAELEQQAAREAAEVH